MPSPACDLDTTRLVPWLRDRLPGLDGRITFEKFAVGQSNPTYAIIVDGAPRHVLRRKPSGTLLPSAHAIDREYRVTAALAGSDVPVACPRVYCEDAGIIGVPFYVMDHVAGRSLRDAAMTEAAAGERPALHAAMSGALGALHRIDPGAVGLTGYGRTGPYFARQIDRWTRQYRATETERIEAMERLIAWLPANDPGLDETRIVHGDFRVDNLVFDPVAPRVAAILDWELSTLGHPLADLAGHLIAWHLPSAGLRGLADLDLATLGIPGEQEHLAACCAQAGRAPPEPPHWRFAISFALFRNACIRQGVLRRALDGNASSASALAAGGLAALVAGIGWRTASAPI